VAHWLISARHYKVNLSCKDEGGNNCLLLAVKENSAGLVERIIEYIDHTEMSALEKELFVNTQDENGDSILHIAYR
jgi:ankyrin repeat protein